LTQLAHAQFEKSEAIKRREALLQQINSESDPAWIELVLMQNLGMVPENQQKVYFMEGTTTLR